LVGLGTCHDVRNAGVGAKACDTLDTPPNDAVIVVERYGTNPEYVSAALLAELPRDVADSFVAPVVSASLSAIGEVYDPMIVFPSASYAVTSTGVVVAVPTGGNALTIASASVAIVPLKTTSTLAGVEPAGGTVALTLPVAKTLPAPFG
jgi:hypothetical protein